jgi:hypothetical protein
MARTFKLTNGSEEVDLINIGATGIIAERGGFGGREIPVGIQAGIQVLERWSFNLKASSHDNAASQIQALVKLAHYARDFGKELWRTRPVYLQQQTTNETNARYAAVLEISDLTIPDFFDQPFEGSAELDGFGMTVLREHPWRSGAPGVLGSAFTLAASDGPVSPSIVQLANFRDDGNLTHVFVDDGGVYGSNLLSAGAGTALFPAAPAATDNLYIGSTDIPWKHACIGIATAGVFSWDIVVEAYISPAWTALVLGTDYTVFSEAGGEFTSEDNFFKQTGVWSINIFPNANWQTVAINGTTAYWIRIRLNAVTSTTTVPTKDASAIYAQRKPHLDIPAAALKGDSPATLCVRLWAPSGGDHAVGQANLSRILMGAKSRNLTNFVSHLNAGEEDNPAAWTVALGTDTTSPADSQAPGGAHAAVSFATNSTLINRVQFTGDDLLDDYVGEYLVLARVQQIGGAAGDCALMLRAFLGGVAASDPHVDTREEKTNGFDKGPEVLTLGPINLPFTRAFNADDLDTTDIILQMHAKRNSGSSTLRIYDLILLPIDEWSAGIDDFAIDTESGSGALRGGTVLDLDGGVLAARAVKYHYDGTDLVPTDSWAIMNLPLQLKNVATLTRLYFVLLHYPAGGTWGSEPFVARLGASLAAQVFGHARYAVLRGSD